MPDEFTYACWSCRDSGYVLHEGDFRDRLGYAPFLAKPCWNCVLGDLIAKEQLSSRQERPKGEFTNRVRGEG